MLFKDHIQSEVLENIETKSLVEIFDQLQTYKVSEMNKYFRFFNLSVVHNRKWINKILGDYSILFPDEYPFEAMQQFLLNVVKILSLAGSKVGTELLVSTLTLGEVEVTDSSFVRETDILYLDSLTNGFLSSDSDYKDYMAVSDSDQLRDIDATLTIKVKTPFEGEILQGVIDPFIRETLNRYTPFNQELDTSIIYEKRDSAYYHELLNPYFVCRQ